MTVVKLPHGASKRKMSKPVRQRIRRSSTHSPSPPIDKIEPETKPALPPIVLTVPSMLSAMPVHSKHFFPRFFLKCFTPLQKRVQNLLLMSYSLDILKPKTKTKNQNIFCWCK